MVLLQYMQPLRTSNLICRTNCQVKILGLLLENDKECQDGSSRILNKAKGLSMHGAMNDCPGCTLKKPALLVTIHFAYGISHQEAKAS